LTELGPSVGFGSNRVFNDDFLPLLKMELKVSSADNDGGAGDDDLENFKQLLQTRPHIFFPLKKRESILKLPDGTDHSPFSTMTELKNLRHLWRQIPLNGVSFGTNEDKTLEKLQQAMTAGDGRQVANLVAAVFGPGKSEKLGVGGGRDNQGIDWIKLLVPRLVMKDFSLARELLTKLRELYPQSHLFEFFLGELWNYSFRIEDKKFFQNLVKLAPIKAIMGINGPDEESKLIHRELALGLDGLDQSHLLALLKQELEGDENFLAQILPQLLQAGFTHHIPAVLTFLQQHRGQQQLIVEALLEALAYHEQWDRELVENYLVRAYGDLIFADERAGGDEADHDDDRGSGDIKQAASLAMTIAQQIDWLGLDVIQKLVQLESKPFGEPLGDLNTLQLMLLHGEFDAVKSLAQVHPGLVMESDQRTQVPLMLWALGYVKNPDFDQKILPFINDNLPESPGLVYPPLFQAIKLWGRYRESASGGSSDSVTGMGLKEELMEQLVAHPEVWGATSVDSTVYDPQLAERGLTVDAVAGAPFKSLLESTQGTDNRSLLEELSQVYEGHQQKPQKMTKEKIDILDGMTMGEICHKNLHTTNKIIENYMSTGHEVKAQRFTKILMALNQFQQEQGAEVPETLPITCFRSDRKGEAFQFYHGQVVGRGQPEFLSKMLGPGLSVGYKSISRQHFMVKRSLDGKIMLKNLYSLNHLRVEEGNHKVRLKLDEEVEMKPGMSFSIGGAEFKCQ
jgi:hypothetical protein